MSFKDKSLPSPGDRMQIIIRNGEELGAVNMCYSFHKFDGDRKSRDGIVSSGR